MASSEVRSSARDAALSALLVVDRGRTGAQEALARALRDGRVADPRDRALATMLVFGTLRWRLRLDAALSVFAHRGLGRLDPATLTILRLGAFQLLFLDRIPARAAVSAAVAQTRQHADERRSGFVNAVLRSMSREPARTAPPEGVTAPDLSVRFSLPRWVVERWLEAHGVEQTQALCEAYATPAPSVVRLRMTAEAREQVARWISEQPDIVAVPGVEPFALRLSGGLDPLLAAPFEQGLWVAQDEGAQRITRVLDTQPGERVLDLCAGSGVKTTYLAEIVGSRGRVTAADLRAPKLDRLLELAERWQVADRVTTVALDATTPLPFDDGAFDRILIDAPCTGLGTIRRRPEIKWRRSPADAVSRARTQLAMLQGAASKVRPGGTLLYAVCTFTREECEGVVERLLAEREDLVVSPPAGAEPSGFLRTSPQADDMDGFFMARLTRRIP